MVTHRFGGAWTERKLTALRDYLMQYQVIFSRNAAAQKLHTIYVDAFAGTGDRTLRVDKTDNSLFGYSNETQEFKQGSAKVALGLDRKFHQYIFIDSKASHIGTLEKSIQDESPELLRLCEFIHDDANLWLRKWCGSQNWRFQRAVVFLDPYGMSVHWETIEAIARTKAIDLWILFPFAIGVNRMMPSHELPEEGWAAVLTRVFGTKEWMHRFYETKPTVDLFEERDVVTKIVGPDGILRFFLERLKSVFPHVVEEPMILQNSHNSPMYALCFAAANPKGGKAALNIATYLARKR